MSRRLLLSIAGVTLLSAAGCATPAVTAGTENATPRPGGSHPDPSPRAAVPVSPVGVPPATNVPSPSLSPPPAGPVPVGKPLYELAASDKIVALTLDDGPHPEYTPEVLDLLHRYGIRATFFIVGECAADHPALVREIAQQGHHLANHTWTHPDVFHGLSEAQVRSELERTSDALQQASGRAPTWFRAPGGDWTDESLEISAELGMRPMGWSVDPRDWSRPGTSRITSRVLDAVRPGSIVLNHDGGGDRSQTVEALRTYLPVLIEDGYRFTAPR